MARKSRSSLGLPKMRPSASAIVSAASTGWGEATAHAFSTAMRSTNPRAVSPARGDSSMRGARQRNGMPICLSSAARRGEADASTMPWAALIG